MNTPNRRTVACGIAMLLISPRRAFSHEKTFKLDPKYEPQQVALTGYSPSTIVIDPEERFLYWVESPGFARRYGVGVGKAGLGFKGSAIVGRKAEWPFWRPTDNMIRRSPTRYARYASGVRGGPNNPLGARALYLYKDGHDTMYRVHGTNEPWSIGQAVSNGCIRMINNHVIELYDHVPIGTPVVVL